MQRNETRREERELCKVASAPSASTGWLASHSFHRYLSPDAQANKDLAMLYISVAPPRATLQNASAGLVVCGTKGRGGGGESAVSDERTVLGTRTDLDFVSGRRQQDSPCRPSRITTLLTIDRLKSSAERISIRSITLVRLNDVALGVERSWKERQDARSGVRSEPACCLRIRHNKGVSLTVGTFDPFAFWI